METLAGITSDLNMVRLVSFILISIGILVSAVYGVGLILLRQEKTKYDYINKFEIKALSSTCIFIIAGLAILINSFFGFQVSILFWVRIFLTITLSLILGIVVLNITKYYYPFYMEKRLKILRFRPRISPSGNVMKLLSEEEEDVYLNEGMQAEENVYSVDYDVWMDEKTGFTKVEKYAGHLHAIECPECNYQTLRVVREEIQQSPTVNSQGTLIKHYKCTYCQHKARKTFRVAKLKEDRSTIHRRVDEPIIA